jgi:ATP-dependent DNA helicase RecG
MDKNKIQNSHASSPQKSRIANAFFRTCEIEAWGRCIKKIISACKDVGAPPPQWKYNGTFLLIRIRFPNNYIKGMGIRRASTRGAKKTSGTVNNLG